MINIIKQELEIDETLKRRLEIVCEFCNTTPEIINGSIRKVDKTNLSYIEPHRIIIKNNTFLVFISNDTKELVNNLKTTITSKHKYVLNASDKDKIINYIEKVDKTKKEYKNLQTLSITLNNVDEELKDNKEKIKTLTENNEALNLRIETLNKNIVKKNNEIKELKEENNKLKQMVINWKQKFFDIINFIGNKMFKKKDREKYMDIATDLYENDLIEYKTYDSIREDYDYSVKKDKNKADFEIGM